MLIYCVVCKNQFEQKREWQIYCTPKCRLRYFRERNPTAEYKVSVTRDGLYDATDGVQVRAHDSIFIGTSLQASCYGWFRKGKYLYVGQAEYIGDRMTSHHVIGRKMPILTTDELHIWTQPDHDPRLVLETQLIHFFHPPFNIASNPLSWSDCAPGLCPPSPDIKLSFQPRCAKCLKPFIPTLQRGPNSITNKYCSYVCSPNEQVQIAKRAQMAEDAAMHAKFAQIQRERKA